MKLEIFVHEYVNSDLWVKYETRILNLFNLFKSFVYVILYSRFRKIAENVRGVRIISELIDMGGIGNFSLQWN